MRSLAQSREPCRLDECNHVVKPVLNQFADVGWEVIDRTNKKQVPAATHRESFTVAVMPPVLRERRTVSNRLEHNEAEEGVKQFAGESRVKPLLESFEPN